MGIAAAAVGRRMAAVFAVFGVYKKTSAFAMLMFNSVVSAATAIPVFLIARKTFDTRTAKLAAWVWADASRIIWHTSELIIWRTSCE
jgi:asparagine N-glycosylation enzyme membrane subunit Stt3